jgi:hypothetical protein
MRRTFVEHTVFALLLCLFVVLPSRAQDSKDCTIMTVTNVPPGYLGGQITNGYTGSATVTDGNGYVLGAFVTFSATCQAGLGAGVTNASTNPLTIANSSQDTIPIGCGPGSPSPPPTGGCPNPLPSSAEYCEGYFNYTSNQPVSYSSSASNTFTVLATSASVVQGMFGASCQYRTASATTTCSATSCPLKSITVTPANPSIDVGSTVRYTATGNYSDGSTLTLSPTNYTGVPTQWTSQNTNIATITSPTNNPNGLAAGIATGNSAGGTSVTATNGSISGSALINVIQPTSCCTEPCGKPGYARNCSNCQCYQASPIIFDITGEGYNLTDAANGVMFDILGDGQPLQMGWTAQSADNAFLALPAPDGLVHNGKQLFGNSTPQPPSNTPNGFSALAVYDLPANGGNGDGIIDARDRIFSSLRLWIDANHDGVSQPEELHTLPSLGINSISLSYKASEKTDQYGNVFRYRAQLNPDKPTDAGKTAYDIFFMMLAPATTSAQSCPAPPATGKRPASPILKH